MKLSFFSKPIVIFLICLAGNSNSQNWNSFLNVVVNYVQENHKIRQILQFVNGTSELDEFANFRSTPKFLIDIQTEMEQQPLEDENSPVFDDPQTSLFIVTCLSSTYRASVSVIIHFLSRHAPAKRRPRLLIVQDMKQNLNCTELFKFMWSKNFLDVTVLEVTGEQDFFLPFNNTVTRLKYYNPFSKKLTTKRMSSADKDKADLFPDKLTNLHGYPLAIGFFHYSPYVIYSRNSTGHVTHLDGLDVATVKSLARARNFKIVEILTNKTTWDVANCIREKSQGFFRSLTYNKMQFIADQSIRPYSKCSIRNSAVVQNYQIIYYYALVPMPVESVKQLSAKWKIVNVLFFFGLLLLVWIVSRLMGFDKKNWQLTYLMELALGFGVPHEPKSLIERIMMASMLFTCFMYSSSILSTFTSISLPAMSNKEMESLDDLFASSLVLYVQPNIYHQTSDNNARNAVKFFKRAIVEPISDEECIEYLLKHRNITCFMRDPRAHLASKNNRDEKGRGKIKIIKEYVSMSPGTVLMERASAYIECFESVLLRLGQAGMYSQWSSIYFKAKFTDRRSIMSEGLSSETYEANTKLKSSIVCVLGVGFFCSVFAFVGEVLFHRYQSTSK